MTALPKLGIRVHGGLPARACAEIAQQAEQAGLATVWFAENPFARGILPAATMCTLATSRIRIGAGVFNPFNRHPTLMAMEIGALAELAPGRTSISIGAGIGSTVARMGHNPDKPVPALRDTLTIVRALLRGEEIEHTGRVFSAHKVRLDYRPRPDIPVYLAGRGDLTVKVAGEMADGIVISNMCTPEFSRGAAAKLAASQAAAGRTGPLEIIQYMPCCVAQDGDAARARARRAVGEMLPNYWGLAQKIPFARSGLMLGLGASEQEIAAAVASLRSGADAARVLDDRYTAAFALAGTAEDCLEGACRFAEAGVSELALTFSGPDAAEEMAALGAASRAAGA